MPPPRLKGLDALRGLAAVAVMLFHLTDFYDTQGLAPFRLHDGHYGVELFFIISGFVIFMTIAEASGIRDFVVSRISRLYPAYWCAVIVTAAFAYCMETWPPSPLHVIMNLTMLQSFLMFPIVDNSYWTLAVELEFYCVIGLIFVAGLIERIEILCLGFTALAMCLRIALVGANIEPSTIETFGVPKYGLLQYGHFFVIGICLFQFHAQRVSKLTTPVLLAALAYSCWGGSPASLSPDGLRYFGITCALTLLTWIAVSGRLGLSRCSPLIMLGGISYPLYLVHQRIGSGLMEALHRLGLPDPAAFFTAVATVAALAVAIHVFIEFPGRRCLRRVLAIPPGLPAGLAIGPSAVARLSD